jgi:hypothetical protein
MASLSDILTTAKNVVTAINGLSQTYLSVQGNQISADITTATLLKKGSGRVATVSIIVGGASGFIYDAASNAATSNPIYIIPNTVGIIFVNLPVVNGIVVAPGAGQTVSVSYS